MFDFDERYKGGEKSVLVNVDFVQESSCEDLEELKLLAKSAGATISGVLSCNRKLPDPRFFIGSGKVEELSSLVADAGAETVIFNHELSPSQERNLEKELKCKVITRTALILDIFAQRARTREGKLQVELAQLRYLQTRLVRGWTHLERQAIIDEIRSNSDYSFSVNVKLGDIPKDHLLTEEKSTEICGEGVYTVDHKGVHYRGTRHGEEWAFDMDYNQVFTYPSSVMLDRFSLYVDNEYYDFIPEYRATGKLTILTEEMHRYHINKWKNFPWFSYMYEGKEVGIDLK